MIRYLRAQAEEAASDFGVARLIRRRAGRGGVRDGGAAYGGLVLGVARRQLADRDQADDVLWPRSWRAARAADRLAGTPLANWLYGRAAAVAQPRAWARGAWV